MIKKTKLLSLIIAIILVASCLTGCSDERPSVGTANGVTLSGDDFYFALINNILSVQSSNNVGYADFKDKTTPQGDTYEEYFQSISLNYAVQAVVIDEMFEELDLVWSDENQQDYEKELASYYAQIEGGREGAASTFESYGFDISVFEKTYLADYKFSLIAEALHGETGSDPISADEAIEAFYVNYARVKNILIPTVNLSDFSALSEEQAAASKARYDECMAKVSALAPGDEKGFDDLIDEFNEDPGMESNPDGYIVTSDGSFVESFTQASLEAEVGGYTSCESEYGYHIIMRLPMTQDNIIDEFGSIEQYVSSFISDLTLTEITSRAINADIVKDEKAIKKITKEAAKHA